MVLSLVADGAFTINGGTVNYREQQRPVAGSEFRLIWRVKCGG